MKTRVLIAAAVLMLALAACQPQFFTDLLLGPGGAAQEAEDQGASGKLQLKIPSISSYLAGALGLLPPERSAARKAILIVSKVDLELYKDGNLYKEMTAAVDSAPGGATEIEWPMIPAADGYHVEAYVYNDYVDPDVPLLHGVSEVFSVVAGATTDTVWILPTPIAPIAVPYPDGASETLDSCWDTGEVEEYPIDPGPDGEWGTADDIIYSSPVYGWADERWFLIDVSSFTAVRVNADVSAGSGVYVMVVDQGGNILTNVLSGAMGDFGPAYWDYGGVASIGLLTADPTYYLGLVTVSEPPAGSVSSTVDVTFEPFADDPYEENDSIDAAYTVDKATEYLDCVDLDPVQWDAGWPSTGGDWYRFVLTSGDDPNVSVAIVFDHDVSNLKLELYSWNGVDPAEWIAASDTSAGSGPGPVTPEMELIDSGDPEVGPLDPGEYYIWVHAVASPVGAGYALQWVAGTGTISIGIK